MEQGKWNTFQCTVEALMGFFTVKGKSNSSQRSPPPGLPRPLLYGRRRDPPGKVHLRRFRSLTWIEQTHLVFPPKSDQREVILAHALTDVSGLPVPSEVKAAEIIRAIPSPIRWRLWVLYRGKLPDDRVFTSKPLYTAPDRKVYDRRLLESGDTPPPDTDDDVIARRYGAREQAEARALQQAILAQAKRDTLPEATRE